MMENSNLFLPIFSFPTSVHYYCDNGFITSDLEEAKAHGYGKNGNKATSFGHGNAFETFDHSILPEVNDVQMKLEAFSFGYLLTYFTKEDEEVMRHEVWYDSNQMENGRLKPLVGTAKNPYNYIDQGEDIYIFERDGYVMVLSAMNWEAFSSMFTGFKVKKEDFYRAWDKMDIPKPNR